MVKDNIVTVFEMQANKSYRSNVSGLIRNLFATEETNKIAKFMKDRKETLNEVF